LHPELRAPCITEMAYLLEAETDVEVFLVGFSLELITYTPSKLKFLSGLGYAIYIAACGFEDPVEDEHTTHELDSKVFLPKKTSSNHLDSQGAWTRKVSEISLASSSPSESGQVIHGMVSVDGDVVSPEFFMSPTWDPMHPFSYPGKLLLI